MKIWLAFSLVSFLTLSALSAQDQIILINGDTIDAQVLEVGDNIRYKRTEVPDGPVYVLEKVKVRKVVYANGFEETFNGLAADNSSFNAGRSWLRMENNKYYEGDFRIKKDEFLQLLSTQPDVLESYNSGRSTLTAGKVTAGVGLGLALTGYIRVASSVDTSAGTQAATPGLGQTLTGLGVGILGIVIGTAGKRKMKESVNNYNFQLGRTGSVAPAVGSDGIGLALKF